MARSARLTTGTRSAPTTEMNTRWRVPLRDAAWTRLRALSSSPLRLPAQCTMISAPSTAAAIPSPVARSPVTYSIPSAAWRVRRLSTRTLQPVSRRRGTRRRPSVPVPPVTKMVDDMAPPNRSMRRHFGDTWQTEAVTDGGEQVAGGSLRGVPRPSTGGSQARAIPGVRPRSALVNTATEPTGAAIGLIVAKGKIIEIDARSAAEVDNERLRNGVTLPGSGLPGNGEGNRPDACRRAGTLSGMVLLVAAAEDPRNAGWPGYRSRPARLNTWPVGPQGGKVATNSASRATSAGSLNHSPRSIQRCPVSLPAPVPAVRVGPGISSFTAMLFPRSSAAKTRVSALAPALATA